VSDREKNKQKEKFVARRRNKKHEGLRKGDLKPGMRVHNFVGGTYGEIRGRGKKLLRAHKDYVSVRIRNSTGNRVGGYRYAWWLIKNLSVQPILIARL
jgi:hypothetical protein